MRRNARYILIASLILLVLLFSYIFFGDAREPFQNEKLRRDGDLFATWVYPPPHLDSQGGVIRIDGPNNTVAVYLPATATSLQPFEIGVVDREIVVYNQSSGQTRGTGLDFHEMENRILVIRNTTEAESAPLPVGFAHSFDEELREIERRTGFVGSFTEYLDRISSRENLVFTTEDFTDYLYKK